MKMQETYGIFESEIDDVLAAVRSHRPLAEIETIPCPCCGAKITVEFSPEGNGFQVQCAGDPPHLSTHQEIINPPSWWKERIWKTGAITFYWREWSAFSGDGTLEMKMSGGDEDGSHWTGVMQLRTNHPDYPLWCWIIEQGNRFKTLISDEDLEVIREEYRQTPK